MEFFSGLTPYDILLAAALAYIITRIVLGLWKLRRLFLGENGQMKNMDTAEMLAQCKALFPIETVHFRGKIFKRGMQIKIVTVQKKVIEGELIGKSKSDVLCVWTKKNILASDMDKIEDIAMLDDDRKIVG